MQLLQYQEKLQDKSEERNMAHESTQTSFLDHQNLKTNHRILPKLNHSPQPQEHLTEFTLTFRDLQLETIIEQPPSPQPSFTGIPSLFTTTPILVPLVIIIPFIYSCNARVSRFNF